MSRLNYKHLHYFWVVAQEKSLSRAAQRLHLTPQTICSQIRALERQLGTSLLRREGRSLVLTEAGRTVFGYAHEMFSLSEEMVEALQHQTSLQARRFRVGVADCLPKLVAYRLLQPVLELPQSYRILCREGTLSDLTADLATHRLDLVLSDQPLAATASVKAYSHLLGECGISFFGTAELHARYGNGFPAALDGAPFLAATSDTASRGKLWRWFEQQGIQPHIVAEFADSALMKVFGQAGIGIFYAPSLIEVEVIQQYQVNLIGRVQAIREQFYAISLERQLKHPAVMRIHDAAKRHLFAALEEDDERSR